MELKGRGLNMIQHDFSQQENQAILPSPCQRSCTAPLWQISLAIRRSAQPFFLRWKSSSHRVVSSEQFLKNMISSKALRVTLEINHLPAPESSESYHTHPYTAYTTALLSHYCKRSSSIQSYPVLTLSFSCALMGSSGVHALCKMENFPWLRYAEILASAAFLHPTACYEWIVRQFWQKFIDLLNMLNHPKFSALWL